MSPLYSYKIHRTNPDIIMTQSFIKRFLLSIDKISLFDKIWKTYQLYTQDIEEKFPAYKNFLKLYRELNQIDEKIQILDNETYPLNEEEQYLISERLPYESRNYFKVSSETKNQNFKTVREHWKDIQVTQDRVGLLIYGEVGVGKTRLMYEIGRLAKDDGWIVFYKIDDLEDINRLKLKSNQSYLLLFESVEEESLFQRMLSKQQFSKFNQLFESRNVRILVTAPHSFHDRCKRCTDTMGGEIYRKRENSNHCSILA